eukprot:7381911-Prymnesium_polylepis.1
MWPVVADRGIFPNRPQGRTAPPGARACCAESLVIELLELSGVAAAGQAGEQFLQQTADEISKRARKRVQVAAGGGALGHCGGARGLHCTRYCAPPHARGTIGIPHTLCHLHPLRARCRALTTRGVSPPSPRAQLVKERSDLQKIVEFVNNHNDVLRRKTAAFVEYLEAVRESKVTPHPRPKPEPTPEPTPEPETKPQPKPQP